MCILLGLWISEKLDSRLGVSTPIHMDLLEIQ